MSAGSNPWDVVESKPLPAGGKPSGGSEWEVVESKPAPGKPQRQETAAAPAPDKPARGGILDRAKNAIAGPGTVAGNIANRSQDEAPTFGQTMQRAGLDLLLPGLGSIAPKASLDKPIVNLSAVGAEDLVPGSLPGVGAIPKTQKAVRGAIAGAEEFGSSMTTPENVAILGATAGLGAAGKAVTVGAKAARNLGRLVSGKFSFDMLKGAYDKYPEFRKQVDADDVEGAAKSLVGMGLDVAMGVVTGKHAVSRGTPAGGPARDTATPSPVQAEVDRLRAENAKLKGTPAPPKPEVDASKPAVATPVPKIEGDLKRGRTEKFSDWQARVKAAKAFQASATPEVLAKAEASVPPAVPPPPVPEAAPVAVPEPGAVTASAEPATTDPYASQFKETDDAFDKLEVLKQQQVASRSAPEEVAASAAPSPTAVTAEPAAPVETAITESPVSPKAPDLPKAAAEPVKSQGKPRFLPVKALPGKTVQLKLPEPPKPVGETPAQEIERLRAENAKLSGQEVKPAREKKPEPVKPVKAEPVQATTPVEAKAPPKVKTQVEKRLEREAAAKKEAETKPPVAETKAEEIRPTLAKSRAEVQKEFDNFKPKPGEDPLEAAVRKLQLSNELLGATQTDLALDKNQAIADFRKGENEKAAAKEKAKSGVIDVLPERRGLPAPAQDSTVIDVRPVKDDGGDALRAESGKTRPQKLNLRQKMKAGTGEAPARAETAEPAAPTGPDPTPEAADTMQRIFGSAKNDGMTKVRIQPVDDQGKPMGTPVEMDLNATPATEVRRVAQELGGHRGGVTIDPSLGENPNNLKKWFRRIEKPTEPGVKAEDARPSKGPTESDPDPGSEVTSTQKIKGFPTGTQFTYIGPDANGFKLMTPRADEIVVSPEDFKTFKSPEDVEYEDSPVRDLWKERKAARSEGGGRDRKRGERGAALPEFVSAGLSKVYEKAMEKIRKDPDTPPLNYAGFGLKSAFVRNLGQLEEVSPRAAEEARRMAASRSQAAAVWNQASPDINAALKEGGMEPEEFRQMLVQGRLHGVRDRWLEYAEAVPHLPDEDLGKAYKDWMGGLVSKIEGKQGLPQDIGQTAAALIEGKDYDTARAFLESVFSEAAGSVAEMVPDDQFLQTSENPGFQKALDIYKNRVESQMAESHERNEGVLSDALGPFGYFPLTPVDRNVQHGPGRKTPYHRPANLNNRFTTGLGDAYDTSVETFKQRLSSAIWANNKAKLFDVLREEGLSVPMDATDTGDTFDYNGKTTKGQKVETRSARTLIKDGRAIPLPGSNDVIPSWLAGELAPILDKGNLTDSDLNAIVKAVNTYAIKGIAEPVFHTSNIAGALVANTPFLGTRLRDKAISGPFTKSFGALGKILFTDPKTPEAAQDIVEMAKLGVIPERYGSVTYLKRLAEDLGAEKETLSLTPFLFGPHGLDIRARLYMYRLAKDINPNASSQQIYDFVNQLGNYTTSLQSGIERSAKKTGLAPFYTAGSTMNRNAFNAWTSGGPMPKDGPGLRTWHTLTTGALGTTASWAVTYRAMTGKWPWEDERAKFMQIPASDWMRDSPAGKALWGDNSDTGYLSFEYLNPIFGRGARVTGLRGAFDTAVAGGDSRQMFEAGVRDVVNSHAHPFIGPIPRAAFVGLSSMAAQRPYEPYWTAGGFLPAGPVNATAGQKAAIVAKELNSFYGAVPFNTGFGPQEEHDSGDKWTQMIVGMILPKLVQHASDPEKRRIGLEKNREQHDREQPAR